MSLDLVMPVWWGNHPDWGTEFLDGLPLSNVRITVMNYRTNFNQLRQIAIPFFVWAEKNNGKIRMALEAGPLPDENRMTYAADTKQGELWLFQIGDHDVLTLLNGVKGELPGQAYKFQHRTPFKADRITFAGNLYQMRELAKDLESEWSIWPSFEGLAIHGLETLDD
jgi:hypothetical protein